MLEANKERVRVCVCATEKSVQRDGKSAMRERENRRGRGRERYDQFPSRTPHSLVRSRVRQYTAMLEADVQLVMDAADIDRSGDLDFGELKVRSRIRVAWGPSYVACALYVCVSADTNPHVLGRYCANSPNTATPPHRWH